MGSGDGGSESRSERPDDRATAENEMDRTDADGGRGGESGGVVGRARWVATTDHEAVAFVREVASSLAIVAAIGLVLFLVSGVWPPMVAVESSSMAPNLQRGDLVFIMEEHRFAGEAAVNGTGVIPYKVGAAVGYKKFNKYGDVIIYHRNGKEGTTPIIHRARFWVSEGENWYDEAKKAFLGGADNCKELSNCPAEHAGFITKGDNNSRYDQVGVNPISEPVKPKWIVGTAEFSIPWLGRIRLFFGKILVVAMSTNTTGTGVIGGPVAGALAGVGAVRVAS